MAKGNQKNVKQQPKVVKLPTVDKAKQTLIEDAKKREELCFKEVQQVLKKHNCTMIPVGEFAGGNIKSAIRIISN